MSNPVITLSDRAPGRRQTGRPLLDAGYLHEIHAREDDRAAALAFALGGGNRPARIVLVRMAQNAGPCGEGLAALGVDPARLILVDAPSAMELLRAGHEAARCGDAGLVLLETRGSLAAYDLTASRRLALAVQRSRGAMVMLRLDAEPRASAAQTRWNVTSTPSLPLAAGAPGPPAIEVELLRWRSGPAGQRWRLEWDAHHAFFQEAGTTPPLPGAVVPLPLLRTAAARL